MDIIYLMFTILGTSTQYNLPLTTASNVPKWANKILKHNIYIKLKTP